MHSPHLKWVPLGIALILISPLFNLPRPTNISSIPWRVELLFSAFLLATIFKFRNSSSVTDAVRELMSDRRRKIVIGLLAVFCFWSFLSSFWAASPAAAMHHSLVWSTYVVVLLIAYFLARSHGGRSMILVTFGAVAIFVGALALFDFLTIQDFASQVGALRIRYAKFAEMLATIAPVLFGAALTIRDRKKFWTLLSLGLISWVGVMISLSKGAFLAGIAGFVLLFLFAAIFKSAPRRRTAFAATVWITATAILQIGVSNLISVPSTLDYVSGAADASRSTSNMRVFTWKVAGEMISSHPILGVGADNFGLEFNRSRSELGQAQPNDPDHVIGEDYVFERAHNEPLQIIAELGIVGALLVAAVTAAVLLFLIRAVRGRRRSTLFFGSMGGLLAFAVSSMFSSFSFRAYQNGAVFFIVLALTFAAARNRDEEAANVSFESRIGRRAIIAAFTLSLLLFGFSLVKASSQYILLAGQRSTSLEEALVNFELASKLDPDNPGADLAAAEALAGEKRSNEAIPHFRRSIARGFGVSVVYSYLANAQEMSGDLSAAEATLQEAVSIFPRSAFLQIRLALVLEKNGKHAESAQRLSLAGSLDERQANGWYSVIKDGILNAHLKATAEPNRIAPPPELLPENAIHAYNTEKVRVD